MKRDAVPTCPSAAQPWPRHAIRAGLVDEWHQFLTPIIVGGGTHFLPQNVRVALELEDERRFDNGVVYLNYRTRSSPKYRRSARREIQVARRVDGVAG